MLFILACLAVWRICHFISKEDGPMNWMWGVRQFLWDSKNWVAYEIAELLSCVQCLSVWVSLPFAFICFDSCRFLYWLSISSVAILLEAFHGMLRGEK